MTAKIPKDLIVKDIKRVIEETKDTSFKTYKQRGQYSGCAVRRILNGLSWANFLKELGYDVRVHHGIDKDVLIEDVLRVFQETGNTKQENYLKNGKYSRSIINRIFGSWNKMLKALGYQANMLKPGQYTKEDILNEYIRLKESLGHPLSAAEFRKYGRYSQPIIDKVFGSFTNMKKELGEIIDARFLSDEELEKDILRLYNQYGVLSEELICNESIVSYPTILARYKTLENLCNKINIPFNPEKNKSKLLIQCLTIIKQILGDNYELEKTFPWLRNPETNRPLFIDIFYTEFNLAIEVDGMQHYKLCKFNPTKELLVKAQARDAAKEKLLKEHGYRIIRITIPSFSHILEKIKNVI